MATTNSAIAPADGWVEIDFNILSNRGGHDIEFFPNATIPANNAQGHLLHPSQGVKRSELPDESEKVWFNARQGSVTLTVSV